MSYVIAHRVATQEALRDATQSAEIMARAAVEPLLADGDLEKSQGLSELDQLARERLLADPVVAVRLWRPDGTVVYSTETRLIGQQFPLGDEELEILAEGGVEAEVSDLTKPENQYERGYGALVEVYLPVRTGDGRTYLFETYTRQSAIDDAAQQIMGAFLPVLIGSLLVLTGILVGLAWRMARRLQRDSEDRERLLHRALDSSETERRRIAADLHDGVVQDLAGVSYTLAALADRADDDAARRSLDRTADATRGAVRSLRSLLVDIYPQSLATAGLGASIADLLAGLPDSVVTTFDPADAVPLPEDQQAALYRAARETIQNVARHSQARHVTVGLAADQGGAVLTVTDDGRGFDPDTVPSDHLGLQLLADLALSVSGSYTVESRPGAGTTVTFRVPG
ncbi:MAG: sensor histidine kinase [Candidatus Nanopelagicales bacterium]